MYKDNYMRYVAKNRVATTSLQVKTTKFKPNCKNITSNLKACTPNLHIIAIYSGYPIS